MQLNDVIFSLNANELPNLIEQKNWSPVAGGVTNFNYRLSLTEREFFIQILDPDKLQRLPSQQFVPSNHVMEKVEPLKKWLVHCFYESKELRVFDWVDAENTTIDRFNEQAIADELLEFLATLHSNISILPILDINQHLDHYFQLAVKRNPEEKERFQSHYQKAKQLAKSFVPSKNCHNDLSPGNLLLNQSLTQSRLIIVDWEYACISDPFFDIAGFCLNFGLTKLQEEKLIQNYSQKMSGYTNLKKYYEMKALYQLVSQLWCA